jgi:hypothetical protein
VSPELSERSVDTLPLKSGVIMKKLSKTGLAAVLCTLAVANSACAQAQVPAPAAMPVPAPMPAPVPGQVTPAIPPEPAAAPQASSNEQQLVAPIALYPDPLVAQILAASTYPSQIVQAARWMRRHATLKGQALAGAVNKQAWDPSVKALTQFPTVLANMSQNLSWTTALGDAYLQDQQGTLAAVQVLRQRAQAAGHLDSSAQQTVTTQDQSIEIEPVDPQVVVLPAYDPWLVYGSPIAAYPGWVDYPGLFYPGPGLYFDAALGFGLFAGLGWGWHHWGSDWYHHRVMYNHAPYISHGRGFAGRFGGPGAGTHLAGAPAFHGHIPGSLGFHSPGSMPGGHGARFGAAGGFDRGALVSQYTPHEPGGPGGGFHSPGIGAAPHIGGMHQGIGGGMHAFGGAGMHGGFGGGMHGGLGGGGFHGGGGGFHGGGGGGHGGGGGGHR